MSIQKIRGTRDILYDQIKYWRLINETAKDIFESTQYLEISTPIIESTELFAKSIGQETDIVSKEMYSFQDQGDRKITLRPEGTTSIVRSFIENTLFQSNSINRFWYNGPMFRYERPQKGRQRQFHQIGVECFGTVSPKADAEVIFLAVKFLQNLTCKNLCVEINSIGDIATRVKYQEKLKQFLLSHISELDTESVKRIYSNPLRIFDSKNLNTQKILNEAPKLYNFLDVHSKQHFEYICKYLDNLNIPYVINNKLVRGLDYYNNTTFEIKTNINSYKHQKTICGGGRYDSLIYQLGGSKTPAVGWAIGVERLLNTLSNTIDFPNNFIDVYIASQGYYADEYSLSIMKLLQTRKIIVMLDLDNKSFRKQLKKAYKILATVCLIIGEEEMSNNTIIVKWLKNGMQEIVYQETFPFYIQYLQYKINILRCQ